MSVDFKDLERRMDGAINVLKEEFAGLRGGRATAAVLDPVMVEAYGAMTPLNQLGSVGVPEPRMLSVQVWDQNLVPAVDKAIRNSGLGFNPMIDGNLLRIPMPPLNEERRAELAKLAGKYAESARIAVRNIRRDGMDELKKMEKASEIGKDEHKNLNGKVQDLTDKKITQIDEMLSKKEEEVMQV